MRLEVLTTIPALLCALALSFNAVCDAQNTDAGKAAPLAAMAPTAVPALVPYSGTAMSLDGKQLTGEVAITFLIFKEVQGGEPLWVETQTVSLDATGHYLVQLGASSPAGLPTTTFASGEGRWLEAQIAGQEPRPRVLLSSVPYAMKAADAETLGGVPAAEFVTRAQLAQAARDLTAQASPLVTPFATTTGSGTTNYIPLWTSSSALGNSLMYQSGSNVEIGTLAAPAGLTVFGNVSNSSNGSFPTYTATAYNSVGYEGPRVLYNRYDGTQAAPGAVKLNDTLGWMDFYGYDGSSLQRAGLFAVFADATPTAGIVPGRFQMNTANASGVDTARLTLYSNDNVVMAQHGGKVGIGTGATPAATLEVNGTAQFDGNITFASTQTFPVKGTGGGTVTSVATGAGLTGGPVTTTGTISLNPNIAATTGTFAAATLPVVSATDTADGAVGQLGTKDNFDGPVGVFGSSPVNGVFGNSTSHGYGVYGTSTYNAGVAGSSNGVIGVYGTSQTGDGVEGASNTGYGVHGVGTNPQGIGVFGESTDDGMGISGKGTPAVYGRNVVVDSYGILGDDSNGTAIGVYGYGDNDGMYGIGGITGVYGYGPSYGVYSDGNIGTANAVTSVAALEDNRAVEFYSVSSTENWFEDFGSGQLKGGAATITLDPTFAMAVNEEAGYHVFLTPNGDCEGLYVTKKTAAGFEVHELRSGTSNVDFEFRIVAKRRGFEGVRMEQLEADADTVEAIREQVRNRPGQRRLVLLKPGADPGKTRPAQGANSISTKDSTLPRKQKNQE